MFSANPAMAGAITEGDVEYAVGAMVDGGVENTTGWCDDASNIVRS